MFEMTKMISQPLIIYKCDGYMAALEPGGEPKPVYVYRADVEACPENFHVKDIGFRTQLILMSTLIPEIRAVHNAGGRCTVVLVLHDFPVIQMRLDTIAGPRGEIKYINEKLTKELEDRWNNYDRRRTVPVLLANEDISYSAVMFVHLFDDLCLYCGQSGAGSKCGTCKLARYCSKECQKRDWPIHKHHHL